MGLIALVVEGPLTVKFFFPSNIVYLKHTPYTLVCSVENRYIRATARRSIDYKYVLST